MSDRTRKKAAIKRASAEARRSATRLDGQALRDLQGLYQGTLSEIKQELAAAADQQNQIRLERLGTVRDRLEAHLSTLKGSQGELLIQTMGRAAQLGVGPWEPHLASVSARASMDKALLMARSFTANDGLQLSDRIWRINDHSRDAVIRSVERAVIRGHDASRSAAEFLEKGLPVPGELQKAQQQANPEAIGRTVGRTLLKDEGSPYENARRLFRTEINRAHGLAYQEAAFEDEDVIGTRFLLSPNHRHRDICDMHASVNRHGLGRGVYPQGKSPWPAHPNTISYEEAVFADEVTDSDKAGKENRITWLRQQPWQTQQAVLRSQKKVEALNGGVLTEQQISTPWKVLQQRYQRQGIDVEQLKPLPKPDKRARPVTLIPRGEAVSNALQAQGYKQVTVRTLAAIDQVHGDGRLPEIPVKRTASSKYNGQYRFYPGGAPVDIRISSHGQRKELTLAHEIGHFLDNQGVNGDGRNASARDHRFDKWREAVANSKAIQSLVKMFDGPNVVEGYPVSKKHIHYLLETHEIWARSYAQYIASRSGDPVMLEQLRSLVGLKSRAKVYYAYQWDEDDFKPIQEAIDDLFIELGWIDG